MLALPGQALDPGLGPEFTGGANPMGRAEIPTEFLLYTGLTLMLVTSAAGFAALAVRFRRRTSVERQQVKWFAFAASLYIVVGTAAVFLWYESVLIQGLFALTAIGLPIGAGSRSSNIASTTSTCSSTARWSTARSRPRWRPSIWPVS